MPLPGLNTEPQWSDALDALEGLAPLAIVERRKAPRTFRYFTNDKIRLEDQYRAWIHIRTGSEGPELVISQSMDTIRAYVKLIEKSGDYPRALFQTRLGELLGYSTAKIREWLNVGWPTCQCECSKCGGPITRFTYDRLEEDARKARTQFFSK